MSKPFIPQQFLGGLNIYSRQINTLYVDGFASPGRVRFQGVARIFNWKKNQAVGMGGASLIGSGRDLCEFTVSFDLWDDEHFPAWELFKELLEPPLPNTPPPAQLCRNFQHPILADVGITDVVVKERGALMPNGNFWTAEVKCSDYRAPEPAKVKPRGGVPAAKAGITLAKTEADRALDIAIPEFEKLRAAANK